MPRHERRLPTHRSRVRNRCAERDSRLHPRRPQRGRRDPTARLRLAGAGGPNDVIQFVSDNWPFALEFFAKWAGNHPLETLWRDWGMFLARFHSRDRQVDEVGDPLLRSMAGPAGWCNSVGTTVTAVAPTPTQTIFRRGVGFELKSGDAGERSPGSSATSLFTPRKSKTLSTSW